MNQRQLLKGAFFLIIAGFSSRFIGFFYRIYLSNMLGAKNLGIYQLIFPIYSICYTIYASGIQTAISKIVASKLTKSSRTPIISPFFTGASISIFLSLLMSLLVYTFAPTISTHILKEESCIYSLRILSLVFPFCGVTACINGFYYAIKKTGIPSISQLVEQISRVGIVFICCSILHIKTNSPEIAVIGLVFGEAISCIFIIIALLFNKDFLYYFSHKKHTKFTNYFYSYKKLMLYTLPLTFNKLLLSSLNSIESILIPIMLTKYGLSHNESLVIYGVLTGMSMSFILFPSTITNSLSVVLLPTISEANANNKNTEIESTVSKTLHYSLIIGLFSLGLFAFWGNEIGRSVFNNKSAGFFIQILAWLCPFLYITTTFSSILNGLGCTKITFRNSIISASIKLLFVITIVPRIGINGYLLGMLFSSIILCFLDLFSLKSYIEVTINLKNSIIKPGIIILFTGLIINNIYLYILLHYNVSNILLLICTCILFLILYIFLLIKQKLIKLKLT